MAKINISSFTSARGVQFANGTCYLRWYYTQGEGVAFSFSDGEVWRPDSTTHYREYSGTVASNVVTMPTLEVQPTTDLTNTTSIRAKAVLLDANRSDDTAITLFSDWEIPHSLGSTISFSQLETHNSGRKVWRIEDTQTLNRRQIEELVEEANNVGNPATVAAIGRGAASVAPRDPAFPVFITDNDPRVNAFLNPKASPYGAMGDGVADDTAELQEVMDALDWSIGGLIVIPAGHYKTSANITLPREAQYETYSQVTILAYGVVIEPTTAVTAVFEYMPTSHSEAYNVIYNRVNIFGLQVKAATRTSGQVAIRIGATEGLHLQDCDFVNIDGTDLVFAIRPVIDNCNTSRPTQYGFGIRSGKDAWAGETADGAPSNVPVLRSCRVWPGAGSIADFYIEGSDQWALYDCISDSFDAGVTGAGVPQYNLLVDETNYTLGQGGIVSGFYTEANNNPTTAVFGIKARGKVILERVRRYDPDTTVWVDATGSTSAAEITLREWSRIDTMPVARFLTASGVQWLFDHVGESSSQFILNGAWWVGGTVGNVSQWGKFGIVVNGGSSVIPAVQLGRYDSTDAEASFGIARAVSDWLLGTAAGDMVLRLRDRTKKIVLGLGNGGSGNDKAVLTIDAGAVGAGNTGILILEDGTEHRVKVGVAGSGPNGTTDRQLYLAS